LITKSIYHWQIRVIRILNLVGLYKIFYQHDFNLTCLTGF
jgi:hypothetical protein